MYVEKPVSHSPWEGRKMVEAARRYDRIVQVGTQNRSAHYNMLAKEYIDSGKLGVDPHGPGHQSKGVAQFAGDGRQRTARRPELGHVDRPGARIEIQRRTTIAAGITFGDFPAATSSTTACTRWTWPAG